MSRIEDVLLLDMWLKVESYACCSFMFFFTLVSLLRRICGLHILILGTKRVFEANRGKKQMMRFNEETEKINNTILNILLELIAKIGGPIPIYA